MNKNKYMKEILFMKFYFCQKVYYKYSNLPIFYTITGTTHSTKNEWSYIDYPDGFNSKNTIVVYSAVDNLGIGYYNDSNYSATNILEPSIGVLLDETRIRIRSSNQNKTFKIVLMRMQ